MRFVARVYPQVSVQVCPLGEPFAAELTAVGVLDVLLVVELEVGFELFRGGRKRLPAQAARVVLQVRVATHVTVDQERRSERLQTYLAAGKRERRWKIYH